MKKILFGLFIFVSCLVLISFGVKTRAVSTPVMVNGASIRTNGKQGLKFSASVDSLDGITEKGFYVALGEHTKAAIETAIGESSDRVGGKKLIKVVVDGEDLDFHVVIYNIQSSAYEQKITALAYVNNGTTNTYAEASVSRSIFQVATDIFNDPGSEPNEYIDRIVCTSTFNLNGGLFTDYYSFNIDEYNSGNAKKNVITLAPKATQSNASGLYWYKVSLKQSNISSSIFTVVERVPSGRSLDESKDYDYVIATHESNQSKIISALSKTYVNIPRFAAGAEIKTSNNYEMTFGSKLFLEPDESLPSATKPYYDFAGWYNEIDFSGSVKTEKEGDIAEIFYAKWTPTNYTLSFDLQGGEVDGDPSKDDITFTYESNAIALPAANLMTRTDYTFVEWNTRSDGTGDSITSIPAGSHGNITVYAIWAADAPVDVVLSAADTAALALITPTKFVKSDFTAGRFSINGDVYETGTGAFASIAAALAAASEDDVIYVFDGTYASDITISTAGVTIAGPNYNISGTASRASEASVQGVITVSANNVTLNGIKLTGTGKAITWTSEISGLSILNLYSNASGKSTTGGRTGIISSDSAINNLVIRNIYLTCTSTDGRNAIAIYGTVNGLTIKDSYMSNGATARKANEIIRIHRINGTINIDHNEFYWATSQFALHLGYTSNGSDEIDITNNYLHGTSTYGLTTISVYNLKNDPDASINIVGNHFKYFDTGNTFNFAGSGTQSHIYISYNYFDTGVPFKLTNKGNGTVHYTDNKYEVAQNTPTSDRLDIADKAALITAYKGSAEFTEYGSICVYED